MFKETTVPGVEALSLAPIIVRVAELADVNPFRGLRPVLETNYDVNGASVLG